MYLLFCIVTIAHIVTYIKLHFSRNKFGITLIGVKLKSLVEASLREMHRLNTLSRRKKEIRIRKKTKMIKLKVALPPKDAYNLISFAGFMLLRIRVFSVCVYCDVLLTKT